MHRKTIRFSRGIVNLGLAAALAISSLPRAATAEEAADPKPPRLPEIELPPAPPRSPSADEATALIMKGDYAGALPLYHKALGEAPLGGDTNLCKPDCVLEPVEESTTDEERARWDVPPLEVARHRMDR